MAADTSQPDASVDLPFGPVIIKAWAPWCGSCRTLGPIVDEVADQTGIAVVGLRVDTSPDVAERLAVRSVPTLIARNGGTELGRLTGLQARDAVESLFDLAAGTGTDIRPRTPPTLVAARGGSGAALVLAGLLTGSVAVGCIGAVLALWAAVGLIRR